jgi:hypothetical protein
MRVKVLPNVALKVTAKQLSQQLKLLINQVMGNC